MSSSPVPATGGLAAQLVLLTGELRAEGLAVGTSELTDAARALGLVEWSRPEQFREALACTIAKSQDDRRIFDAAFDRFMFRAAERAALAAETAGRDAAPGDAAPVETGAEAGAEGEAGDEAAAGERIELDELRQAIADAIERGDEAALRDLARLTVIAFAGTTPGPRPTGVDLQRIRRELGLLSASADSSGSGLTGAANRQTRDLFISLLRAELERAAIAAAGVLPPARPLRDLDRALPSNPAADLAAVHRAIARLRRQLAGAALENRGARRRDTIDMRRTIRASLETGGVPMRIRTRPSRPRRPEILVLCDVSTSVSSASVFFLSVLHALHDSFHRLRSFVFIERISEVTDVFARERDFRRISDRITEVGGVADVTGYTDYGRVWHEFALRVAPELGPRSIVIVLGDARTNGRDPGAESFAEISAAAGRTFWLNPEPRIYWNYGDSRMSAYEPLCTAALECSNTRQLEAFADLIS